MVVVVQKMFLGYPGCRAGDVMGKWEKVKYKYSSSTRGDKESAAPLG